MLNKVLLINNTNTKKKAELTVSLLHNLYVLAGASYRAVYITIKNNTSGKNLSYFQLPQVNWASTYKFTTDVFFEDEISLIFSTNTSKAKATILSQQNINVVSTSSLQINFKISDSPASIYAKISE